MDVNLYRCSLNTGDHELDLVTPIIAGVTRGKAKATLLAAADDAGFGVDWTTRVNIRLVAKNVQDPPGIVRYE